MKAERQSRPRPVATAIVLAASVFVSLLSLMFAFVQKSEADKQRQLAEDMAAEAQAKRMMSEQAIETLHRELEACRGK